MLLTPRSLGCVQGAPEAVSEPLESERMEVLITVKTSLLRLDAMEKEGARPTRRRSPCWRYGG